jgi:hypothetical protein
MCRRPADAAQLREDPELRADAGLAAEMLDDAFLGMVHLWYSRGDGGAGAFGQDAITIVARKRRAALAHAGAMRAAA